ncbi:hypothetical protein BJ508DRAFT_376641 [Ascobolus immersus RN42]|uniref:Ubiquitin-conjugating enzyme E2-binding protein n=1 Tax=Ascobolus immersus RN42 TaxID=1160509 RepID=A0A3N4I8Z4_ASCIM|nr:hypothetical protein BJ508DRAFT_376641 [Ascobolus immersus RN42]
MSAPSPLQNPQPLVYVESRQNIGSVSISIEHQNPTKAELTVSPDDPSTLHVSGRTFRPFDVRLPAGVPVGTVVLPAPDSGIDAESNMTLKLPIAKDPGTALAPTRAEIVTPWSASELSACKQLSIHCANCNSVLVEKEKVTTWKDLPSKNWAEMMDFWHCHKPDDHNHDHEKEGCQGSVQKKKFGGGFEEKVGTALVGLTELMTHGEDTQGVSIREGPKTTTLACKSCRAVLGDVDERNMGLRRLNKWSIAISPRAEEKSKAYPPICFVSAQLLTLADEQAVRYFYFSNPAPTAEEPGIRLWLFHPDVGVSVYPIPSYLGDETIQPSGTVFWKKEEVIMPVRACKVMFKVEAEGGSSFKEDRVDLPKDVWNRFVQELKGSNGTLPEKDRLWTGWTVGWIRRF